MSSFWAQLGSNVVAKRQVDPNSYRSGVAEGLVAIGQAGQQISRQNAEVAERGREVDHDIHMRELARARAQEAAKQSIRLTEAQEALRTELEELRKNAEPGAAGYDEQADALITKRMQEFLGGLNDDPEIQNRYGPAAARMSAQIRDGEHQWALKRRAELTGLADEQERNRLMAGVLEKPTTIEGAIVDYDEFLGLQDLDETQRKLALEEFTGELANAVIQQTISSGNYDQAEAMLAEESAAAYLSPKARDSYTRQIGAGRRQAEIAKEREAAEKLAEWREKVDAAQARMKAGEDIGPKEWAALSEAGKALGAGVDELTDLGLISEQSSIRRGYRGKSAADLSRTAKAIEQRVLAGKASPEEQRSLSVIQDMLDEQVSRDAEDQKALLEQGAAGRMAILQSLPRDQGLAFVQAQEVEEGLGYLVGLSDAAANGALQGKAILDANKDAIDTDAAQAQFRAFTRTASIGLPDDEMAGRMAVANQIYASLTKQYGVPAEKFGAKLYAKAIRLAFGSRQKNGKWFGGIGIVNGRSVILGDSFTEAGFAQTLARLDPAKEGVVYSNGKPVVKSDFRKNWFPRFVGLTESGKAVYHFYNSSGQPLAHKSGVAFRLTER